LLRYDNTGGKDRRRSLQAAAGSTAGAFMPQQRLYLDPEPQGHGAPRGMGADSADAGKICVAAGTGAQIASVTAVLISASLSL
jgi:hypothetical protein